MKKQKAYSWILFAFMLLLTLAFLYPLFIVIANSVKPLGDILVDPLSLPTSFHFENYANAWKTVEFPKVLMNTLILTVLSVAGIILFSSMTAYWTERHPTRYSRFFSAMLIVSMLIPFASTMIPLVYVIRTLGLANSLQGAVVTYWGVGLAFSFFIIRGAVKALPIDLEEAAEIDGCGPIQVFFKVAFPLLQPTMVTVLIMDIFWIWNDFMIPLILLDSGKLSTIQLAVKKLFSMFASKWDIALPALVMTIAPLAVIFIILQKKVINGILSGAVKG